MFSRLIALLLCVHLLRWLLHRGQHPGWLWGWVCAAGAGVVASEWVVGLAVGLWRMGGGGRAGAVEGRGAVGVRGKAVRAASAAEFHGTADVQVRADLGGSVAASDP